MAGGIMKVRRCLAALGAAWGVSLCGQLSCSDATGSLDDGGVDASADASSQDAMTGKTHDAGRRDARDSGVLPDASHDAVPDATRDAPHDVNLETSRDGSVDATCDVSLDATRDASRDVPGDVTRDAPGDATLDTNHDGSRDAPRDVLRDASRDASRDTLHDAPLDTLRDAAADAPFDAGPPSLVALSVSEPSSTDASPPNALIPQFSPSIYDYYVRCTAGTNALTVSMTASAGAMSRLVQPIVSPSAPQQTLSVSVTEGEAVVAEAMDGTAVTEYWVRCLPHDFPHLLWKPHADAGTPSAGYYLLGTAQPTTGCYSMVLDTNGVPVWYVPSPTSSMGWCVYDVDNVVSGAVSFYSTSDTPEDFEIHQLSPLVTTMLAADGLDVARHELLLLANGDYLVLSTPQQIVDLTGMQFPLPDGGVETLSGRQRITACNLLELAPDGSAVWKWAATDHIDPVKESVDPILTAGTTKLVFDPFHCNSIDVDPTNGNLLVSARQMDSVFYIEKSTGRVLWKMGGAAYNKDGATYVSVADPFVLQHDARFQPDWSPVCNGGTGHISVFDDESQGTRPARAVVYDVVVGTGDGGVVDAGECCDAGPTDGGAAGTATVTWQYGAATSSASMGSFRTLPDGSRVIGWGAMPSAAMTELDPQGNDVLDFRFTDGNTSYRAIKVPLSAFDLGVLRSAAGAQ